MKVAIIGAGGYIGSHLSSFLSASGCVVHDFGSSHNPCFDAATGCLLPGFTLPEGLDVVIYLSQSPFYRQTPAMAWHLLNVNVVSAVRIAELARKAGVGRMLYASTGNVYAPTFLPCGETAPLWRDDWYALSKVQAEEALRLFLNDLKLTVVRLFGVYGPGQCGKLVPSLITKVCNGEKVLIESNPDQPDDHDGIRISLTYIDDVVQCLYKLLTVDSPLVVNLANAEAVSIRQIVESIATYCGKSPEIAVSKEFRKGNLIADTRLLASVAPHDFVPFETGIKSVLATACR